MKPTLPISGRVYTSTEIETALSLDDMPFYRFLYNGKICVIQTGHVTSAQLLSVTGFAASRWSYERTTREWIPLFWFVGTEDEILALVDVEHEISCTGEAMAEWSVTPKGYPRAQFYANPNNCSI